MVHIFIPPQDLLNIKYNKVQKTISSTTGYKDVGWGQILWNVVLWLGHVCSTYELKEAVVT